LPFGFIGFRRIIFILFHDVINLEESKFIIVETESPSLLLVDYLEESTKLTLLNLK
jgi:hypothetical protein